MSFDLHFHQKQSQQRSASLLQQILDPSLFIVQDDNSVGMLIGMNHNRGLLGHTETV